MNELIKNQSTEVALDPEMVKQSKMLSGEGQGNFIPFIPLIQINNTKEKKEVEVDGKMTVVEIPAKEGFNITIKNKETRQYELHFYSEKLSGVILKARYQIKSKYKKVEHPYFSSEFDNWNEIVRVYNKNNREVIAEGTYMELKEIFKTEEKDTAGRPRKSFDLFLILYLHIDDEIFRYKAKMSSYNNWFNYKNSFSENETFVAYITDIELAYSKEGSIEFWYGIFKKGKMIDLSIQLQAQRELQMALNLVSNIKQTKVVTPEIVDDYEQPTIYDGEEKKEDEINVDQIPF